MEAAAAVAEEEEVAVEAPQQALSTPRPRQSCFLKARQYEIA